MHARVIGGQSVSYQFSKSTKAKEKRRYFKHGIRSA